MKAKRRVGGSGAPPKPVKAAAVRRLSTSWPPAAFSVHATMVQPACVKCRRSEYQVRFLGMTGTTVWQDDVATVCDECWDLVEANRGKYLGSTRRSFWKSKASKPGKDDRLIDLVDFSPTRETSVIWGQYLHKLHTKNIKLRRV